jgi:small subunit ribosomal protein S20
VDPVVRPWVKKNPVLRAVLFPVVDIGSILANVARSELSIGFCFMPNTKSAERRARNSARKNLHNRSIKSSLHTLQKQYLALLSAGKKDEAATQLRALSSALDKAAKAGVLHRATADRKKSRLALRLARAK